MMMNDDYDDSGGYDIDGDDYGDYGCSIERWSKKRTK